MLLIAYPDMLMLELFPLQTILIFGTQRLKDMEISFANAAVGSPFHRVISHKIKIHLH